METLEISTVTYLPEDEVYEFLLDFPGYAEYSEYLHGVDSDGDGGAGTEYDIHLGWWKLEYTARTRVTNIDAPSEIEWEVIKDIDAHGKWLVDPISDIPDDEDAATEVTLVINYNADSVDEDVIDLPLFIGLDTVIEKVTPLIESEGEKVVERIIADLEGEERPVDLAIKHTS